MKVEHDRMIIFEDYCTPADEFIAGKSILVVTILIPHSRVMKFNVHPIHALTARDAMMWMWHYAIFLSDLRHIDVPMSKWTWHVQPYRRLPTREVFPKDE